MIEFLTAGSIKKIIGSTSCFFCRLLIFRKILSGIPSVSNSLDQDQFQCFIRPDLDPIFLRRLSADDTTVKPVFSGHSKIAITKVLETK